MDKIIIKEDYRGFQISFDVDHGLFIVLSDHWNDEKSTSTTLKGVKKIVDDFIKENQEFEPFLIFNKYKLTSNSMFDKQKYETLKVIGKRKDDRFQAVDENGKDHQINMSYYSFSENWCIVEPDTKSIAKTIIDQIKVFDDQIDALEKQKDKLIKEMDSKYQFKLFKDWVKKKFPEVKIKD